MNDIKNIINRVIGDLANKKDQGGKQIASIWCAVLEKKELVHTHVAGLKEGTLFVDVDSPAWLYQMNVKKTKILRLLKEEIPEIKNIRFKIGKVKWVKQKP